MVILHNHEPGLTDDAYIFSYLARWVGHAKDNSSAWLTVTQQCFANDMFQAEPIALHSRLRMCRLSVIPFPTEDDVYAWEAFELTKLDDDMKSSIDGRDS